MPFVRLPAKSEVASEYFADSILPMAGKVRTLATRNIHNASSRFPEELLAGMIRVLDPTVPKQRDPLVVLRSKLGESFAQNEGV